MKKLLALLLALLTTFSLIACGGDDNDDSYVKPDEFTADGKLKIQFFGVDFDSLQSKTNDTQLILDVIENKFNVSFDIVNGSANSWKQQLSQYIGGGDVPDIFFHTKNEPSYSTWLEEKYLFNYSEMLDNYPNLKQAFNRFPETGVKAMLGGDYYSYPIVMDQTTDSNVINEHALYYRRDWYMSNSEICSPAERFLNPELLESDLTAALDFRFILTSLFRLDLDRAFSASMLEFDLSSERPAFSEIIAEPYHEMRYVDASVTRGILI